MPFQKGNKIGNRFKEAGYGSDFKDIMQFNWKNTPHNSYMHELMMDGSELMKTRGSSKPYRTSHRSGYGSLDKALTLDTLGSTNNIWNKRRSAVYDVYDVDKRIKQNRRREQMAMQQRQALQGMFMSPINHHRM